MNQDSTAPIYGKTNPAPDEQGSPVRYGSVIELLPEKEKEYRFLHADVWPGVLAAITKANIRNFSIFVHSIAGKRYLFSYFEYIGQSFEQDMATLAEDATTQQWWKETDPCQQKLPGTPPSDQWSSMEMVFHCD